MFSCEHRVDNRIGPGELKLGLDVDKMTGLSLYRPAQEDMTVSVAANLVKSDLPDQLTELVQRIKVTPMVRRFDFVNVEDLHIFEAAVTGFQVLFDGYVIVSNNLQEACY